ncbi:O-antigen ligase family protein [Agrobacterium larrymoorei]|uniref:O-antigen ligase family protein n=1 Tax=Agrobacterium larrymoorei TaxID=160699 RepID=UPI001571DC2B|nr:O-antigen ligase [Agrobacterium larrymoorei]NTJ41910.1 O-antigen ligase family protein [Agrobacterium larrymoorei]
MRDTIQEQSGGGYMGRIRTLVFLGLFLFFWVTTNPFVDLVRVEQSGTNATGGSNLLNQLIFLALTIATVYAAVTHPLRAQICQPQWLVIALFSWFLISSALSNYPMDAIKRTVLALLTCANAGMFLLLPRSEAQFSRLLFYGTSITIGLAYFGVIVMPMRAIHQATELIEPMNAGFWRGQYSHKNLAAAAMLVAAFFGLYLRSVGWRKSGIAIVVTSVFFLLHTGGKSSTAMLPLILCLQWVFERYRWTRWPIAVGGIAAFNLLALGASLSPGVRSVIASLGVDPTFTNRTDIWKIAFEAIALSPILGYGFQGFWQTADITQSSAGLETWAVKAFNGHNAYVDAMLTTGIPGFLLSMALVVFIPLRAVGRLDGARQNSPALSRLFMRVWLYVLYAGCLEVIFFQSGSPIFFLFLVSIFGLELQSRMSLVGARETNWESKHALPA